MKDHYPADKVLVQRVEPLLEGPDSTHPPAALGITENPAGPSEVVW